MLRYYVSRFSLAYSVQIWCTCTKWLLCNVTLIMTTPKFHMQLRRHENAYFFEAPSNPVWKFRIFIFFSQIPQQRTRLSCTKILFQNIYTILSYNKTGHLPHFWGGGQLPHLTLPNNICQDYRKGKTGNFSLASQFTVVVTVSYRAGSNRLRVSSASPQWRS